MNKKKILIFSDWFLPGYKAGGPIRSVSNIVQRISDKFNFTIITSDRDLGDSKPYKGIVTDKIIENKAGYKIMYLSSGLSVFKKIFRILKNTDCETVYFNSMFSVKYTLFPYFLLRIFRRNIKVIIAPRGMLGEGARNIKATKKNLYLKFTSFINLFRNVTWHATDKVERSDIKQIFGKKANIKLASNIVDLQKLNINKNTLEVIKFTFLSRISKKKNLLFAIEIFADMNFSKKVIFDIYGSPEEKEYLEKCKARAKQDDIHIEINFKGLVKGTEVVKIMSEYHFFILPTEHENYGHVIFEALSAGCPVLLSTNTPWRNLEKKEIGWDIDTKNIDNFKKVLTECVNMPENKYTEMSEKAYKYAEYIASDSEIINQTVKLFD